MHHFRATAYSWGSRPLPFSEPRRAYSRRALHQSDQVAFGIKKAGDEASVRNRMWPESRLTSIAFNSLQRSHTILHGNIKSNMAAVLLPCADAAADSVVGFNH